MGPAASEIVLLSALVVGTSLLHWYLSRLGRRLPRRLAAGDAAHGAQGPLVRERWQRRVEIALLVPKLALWIGVAWLLSTRLPEVGMSRDAAVAGVRQSLTAPLFSLAEKSYSALNLVTLPVLLVALWLAVSFAVGLGKGQLARLSGGERGVHESLAILAKLVLSFLGAIVIFQAWGLDVSSLAFLGSVLGVGIGIGLQNIANNFVSGILIGLERPVQPGDFVNVGEFAGTVKKIGARSTLIETVDRVTILVPNSRFLELEVINWSYGSPLCRIHLPVGVAYGSDPALVRAALLEAARAHPRVLSDPRPQARFIAFGNSSLDFELLVWIDEPRGQFRLKSDLNLLVAASLDSGHIEAAAGPAGWSDGELDAVVERMRGANGLEIVDRRHLLRIHPHCFVGSEAVDWLVKDGGMTRAEAASVGNRLVERGIVHHVLDEHGFRDGHFFYRFRADETEASGRDPAGRSASKPSNAA